MNRIRRIVGLSSAPLRPSAVFAAAVLLLGMVVLLGSTVQAKASDTEPKNTPKADTNLQPTLIPRKAVVVRSAPTANASAEPPVALAPVPKPAAVAQPEPVARVHYYMLPVSTIDEFMKAIESGALKLPENVTLTFKEENDVSPRYTLSGDPAAVKKAIKAIGGYVNRVPAHPLLIKVEVRLGDRLLSSPTLRDIAGMPAFISESVPTPSAGIGGFSVLQTRIFPTWEKAGRITLRASIGALGLSVVVPFTLCAEAELSIVRDAQGIVGLTATDLKTKSSRTVPVPQDWAPLVGLRYTMRAEADRDFPQGTDGRSTSYEPSENVRLTLKGQLAYVVWIVSRWMGVSAVVDPGSYEAFRGQSIEFDPTRPQALKTRDWEVFAQDLCSVGHATFELRNGVYHFKPAPTAAVPVPAGTGGAGAPKGK